MSGTIPDSAKGNDSDGHKNELIPFCPWREANLSPIIGFRGILHWIKAC